MSKVRPFFQERLQVGGIDADVPDTILGDSGVITITSAQVLALNATPQTIVPAPGAGKILVPEYLLIHKPAGTAYAGIAAGEDLALRYTDASGTILLEAEPTGFLDQATAQERHATAYRQVSLISSVTPTPNAALVLHMIVGEIITGTSPLYVRVLYRVFPSLFLS